MTTSNKILAVLAVKLTASDHTRLESHLSNWNRLNEILLLGTISAGDLRKLIYLESQGKCRLPMLRKLVTRLKSYEAIALCELLRICSNEKSNAK